MSEANELLESLTDDGVSTYTADFATEPHIVIGADRFITVPEELKRIAVQHDHNIETVIFDCPRFWDEHDMSLMKVQINYMRADGEKGCYVSPEVTVDETDDSIMHFSWTISRKVTYIKGDIVFLVCVTKLDENGVETQHWNSEINRDMTVSEGLECDVVMPDGYFTQERLLDITENGTYEIVPDGGHMISKATVNVDIPGALPLQTKVAVIYENGETIITPDEGYYLEAVQAVVSVGSSGPDTDKPIKFYDYDGTLLYSYSFNEIAKTTELPELPKHDGLVCQGWNFTLDQLKAYDRPINAGAIYITDDAKTRLYITIPNDTRMEIPLNFSQTVSGGAIIDWGDGLATDEANLESIEGTGNVTASHTYDAPGDYVISLDATAGCVLGLGHDLPNLSVMKTTIGTIPSVVYNSMITKVELGKNITSLVNCAFQYCYGLKSITIPDTLTNIGGSAFHSCTALRYITIPNGVAGINPTTFTGCVSLESISIPEMSGYVYENAFSSCNNLTAVTIPNGITEIRQLVFTGCPMLNEISLPEGLTTISKQTFTSCCSLHSILLPASVTTIGDQIFAGSTSLVYVKMPDSLATIGSAAFSGCTGMKVVDCSTCTSIPTMTTPASTFSGCPADMEIRVPSALYDEWVAAWSNWSSYIVAV